LERLVKEFYPRAAPPLVTPPAICYESILLRLPSNPGIAYLHY